MTGRREILATWAVVLGAGAAAWSLAAATLPLPDYYLPPPTAVLAALRDLAVKGILPTYVAESLGRVLIAAVVGLVVGVPVGLLLGMSPRVAVFCYPLLNFFQSVSGIAWLPLMLVWFGFGERTILAAVNYTVLFPLIFNTMLGVRSVPRLYSDALRTLGAPRWRILRDVIVPGALPSIATGMRLGLAYGWRALIARARVHDLQRPELPPDRAHHARDGHHRRAVARSRLLPAPCARGGDHRPLGAGTAMKPSASGAGHPRLEPGSGHPL
jgi:ABC-type nitrate/sulfonate/bicarbonate transport system permease component